MLLLRTQSTIRLIELADKTQRDELHHVFIGLGLIERILIAIVEAPAEEFEQVVIDTLDEALTTALEVISKSTN